MGKLRSGLSPQRDYIDKCNQLNFNRAKIVVQQSLVFA
jgi:hypothetical protein